MKEALIAKKWTFRFYQREYKAHKKTIRWISIKKLPEIFSKRQNQNVLNGAIEISLPWNLDENNGICDLVLYGNSQKKIIIFFTESYKV